MSRTVDRGLRRRGVGWNHTGLFPVSMGTPLGLDLASAPIDHLDVQAGIHGAICACAKGVQNATRVYRWIQHLHDAPAVRTLQYILFFDLAQLLNGQLNYGVQGGREVSCCFVPCTTVRTHFEIVYCAEGLVYIFIHIALRPPRLRVAPPPPIPLLQRSWYYHSPIDPSSRPLPPRSSAAPPPLEYPSPVGDNESNPPPLPSLPGQSPYWGNPRRSVARC